MNELNFKAWLKSETATTTASVAHFARPIFSSAVPPKKQKKKNYDSLCCKQ